MDSPKIVNGDQTIVNGSILDFLYAYKKCLRDPAYEFLLSSAIYSR